MRAIPRPVEIVREAVIVIGGAVLAAWVIGRFPTLKTWIKDQWS